MTRRFVWLAAVIAVLGRFPGALWPLRPDEAGFLLVARVWDPQPDSLYFPHFVDRPPSLIALVRWADWLGGPYALRVVGALACGVAVLISAELVRELARSLPLRVAPAPLHLVMVGTAFLTAAFMITPEIDAVAVKSELLGVPLILASCLGSLRALRKQSVWAAGAAGVLAMSAVGLKQSLVGGLVFGATLLLVALVKGQLARNAAARLAGAALLGASLPVAATLAWALAAGVEMSTLGYAVISFRADASEVIRAQTNGANVSRVRLLLLVFVTTGMALVMVWCLARSAVALRRLTAPFVAAVVMLAVDLTVIGLSGSYWSPYLFTLVAPLIALWASIRVADLPDLRYGDSLTLRATGKWHPRREVLVVAVCVASSVISLGTWTTAVWLTGNPPIEYEIGRAIGDVAAPGDTLVVYGGRADLQWASGLDSPYEHLWSLPMRTMDPDLASLRSLLEGPRAPAWFVSAVSPQAWDGLGERGLADVLETRYEEVGTGCDGIVVRRLVGAPSVAPLSPDCTTPRGRR